MIGELIDDEVFSLSGSIAKKRTVEKTGWSHAYFFNNLQIDLSKRKGLTALPLPRPPLVDHLIPVAIFCEHGQN